MRKVVIRKPGGYARLTLETCPDPEPGPGEVLIAVAATGVNYADCTVRMGLYESAKDFVGWPITPGFEVAGEVVALGPDVTEPPPGTVVMAVTRFDGYASHVVVPRHQVFELPAGLAPAQAAGFPTVFLTAYYALCELARPRPGAVLLVHSAAGGVGSALVQIGKIMDTTVVGVVGASHKVDAVRELGADFVIDKSKDDLWPTAKRHAPAGFDAVFDANGVATLRQSFKHLRPTGRLVVYGFHSMLPRRGGRANLLKLVWGYLRTPRFDPFRMVNDNKSVLAFNLSYLFDHHDLLQEAMAQLLEWQAQGRLRPPKVTTYPLERVADAHRDLESAQTIGKLVLEP